MMPLLATALSFLKRLPWQVYAGIAALGFLWWLYSTGYDNGLGKGRAELAAVVRDYEDAQAEATRHALAAKAETERRYRELAERTDREHSQLAAAADSATDRFIAANRVRCQAAGGSPGGTVAAADDHGAGISAPVSPGIILGEADVRACAALYAYSVSAHAWANGLDGE